MSGGVQYTNIDNDYLFTGTHKGTLAPTVTTQAVTDVDVTTATGNGNITVLGIPSATQHGVCWSESENPTTSDSKTEEGTPATTGAFTSIMTGLSGGTTYYVRAYAINSCGTSYGDDVEVTTSASLPSGLVYHLESGSYDGVSQFTDTSETFNTTLADSHTITFKISADDGQPTSEQGIFGTYNHPNDYWYLKLNTSGQIHTRTIGDGTDWWESTSNELFSDGADSAHVIITVEKNVELIHYKNNVQLGEAASMVGGGSYQEAFSQSLDATIGKTNGLTDFFAGNITNFRIYNKVLSSEERTAVYNNDA
jgi:hypothetical protein